jgi:apolipoprotein N-acyltransferase
MVYQILPSGSEESAAPLLKKVFAVPSRRTGLALLFGLLAAAAMPPFNLVPLLVPAFVGLLWQLGSAATGRRAFADGWYWGMGFFVPGLYWISLSLMADPVHLLWLLPFTLLGLPAFLSLWIGLATLATWRSRTKGVTRILLFSVLWTACEWLRGHVPLGGFPWALIGDTWSGDAGVLLDGAQAASFMGAYGLSLATVLVAALPARLLAGGSWSRRAGPAVAGGVLLAAGLFWGAARLDQGIGPKVPGVTIRIVQTDVPNRKGADSRGAALDRLRAVLAVARDPGADAVSAQIWPESSIEYTLDRHPDLETIVGETASPTGLILTGTALSVGEDYYNSIAAVDHDGAVVAAYHKAHLVPFGEYVPFHEWLNFIPTIAENIGWSLGPGPVTLTLPGLPPVAPIVCYEAIFPHAVIDEAHRPAWLLNVTNDAWFGRSTGPYQHFAMARLRTIEQGLPLLRSANGGLSGVVDAYGRRLESLPLGEVGYLDVQLPEALAEDTFYGRHGDWIVLVLLAAVLGLAAVTRYSASSIRTA